MAGRPKEKRPAARRAGEPPGRRQTLGKSFANAFTGLSYCVRTQRNLRIHLVVVVVVLGLAAVFRVGLLELAVLVLCITVVVVVEMLNTALERAVDLVTSDYHTLAKLSKDVSAGAVLVSSLGTLAVGAIIFLPEFLEALSGLLATVSGTKPLVPA